MNKFWYCFLKDMKLSLKGFYFYIEIGFAAIFIAVVLLAVPQNFEQNVTVYANIEIQGVSGMQEASEEMVSHLDEHGMELVILGSRQEVVERLEKDRSGVGLNIAVEEGKPVFEYIMQGYENEKFKNIMETSIKAGMASKMPGYEDSVEVTTLNADLERLPDRVNILPVFLTLNAAFMGLFIIAAYIFLDKQEGTIKALAVTPAKVWHYLLSKVMVMLVTGLITSLAAVISIAGTNVNYPLFLLAIIVYNCFGTALGLFISSFFDSMAKAMGWLYLSVIVLAFAAVSYFLPAFSPLVIRLLPSYPMLFSFREILLTTGDTAYVLVTVAGFTAAAVVLFLLANMRFKKTITV